MVMTSIPDLLAAKPEVLVPFDNSYLDKLRDTPHLVIGEIAGQDSVAAILTALESSDVGVVLPTAAYTGTEYGDWQSFQRNAAFLRRTAQKRFGKPVLDLTWLGSPPLWAALNGRFITEIVRRFGAYSPCLACHFYLHAIRIPLAARLGCAIVIGGDRVRHDERVKINQLAPVLDRYEGFFRHFELELRQPLRLVSDTAEVNALLGPLWPGGNPQPRCVLARNYDTLDKERSWTETEVMAFVDEFVYPVLEYITAELVAGQPVDYVQVVKGHLSS